MRVLLFEWLTGGGQWFGEEVPDPSCPLQRQGSKMLAALAADFTQIGVSTTVPLDSRLPVDVNLGSAQTIPVRCADELPCVLRHQAAQCDWILLIAPEIDDCLTRCCQWLESYDHKLISPGIEFVRLTSDKQLTMKYLHDADVSVPVGGRLSDLRSFKNQILPPVVVKPIYGAGSEQVRMVSDWAELESFPQPSEWRVEQFVSGRAVSVSVLCGRGVCRLLPPTGQRFDRQPIGIYVDSIHPLPKFIADRATGLARQTMDALPSTRGYIGIDMVIRDSGDDHEHPAVVVEVNPRLTMSYLRLRQLLGPSLVQQMVEMAIAD